MLAQPKSDIIRDASIKRFEFTFDLAWRTIRAFLDERYGLLCHSPNTCLREAYHQGFIGYDDVWIQMTDWRNRIVHEYSQDFADEVYTKLPGPCEHFQPLDRNLGADS